jgi:hypothetical protein
LLLAVPFDTMAPVAEKVEILKQLENPPAQVTPQQASACRKSALLAIGDHIEAGAAPKWMGTITTAASDLWAFVSDTCAHRMDGPQLRGLYLALKGQREQTSDQTQGAGSKQQQQQQRKKQREEQERVEACEAALRSAVAEQLSEVQQAPASAQQRELLAAMGRGGAGEAAVGPAVCWARLPCYVQNPPSHGSSPNRVAGCML